MDRDEGGNIEKDEFIGWMKDVAKDSEVKLTETFHEIDLNHDGKIALKEF